MSLSRAGHIFLLVFCIGSILISCRATKNASSPTSDDTHEKTSPRILFLNYEISRDTTNSVITARLINIIEADGTMKNNKILAFQAEVGDLELQVLDKNQQVLNTLYISNPLDKVVEFVNDRGELQKNMISLGTAEFSVRFQLEAGTSSNIRGIQIITSIW